MPVRYDRSPQLVAGQLLPDVVRVAGQHGVRPVAQVRGEASARLHGVPDLIGVGPRVAQGNDDALIGQLLDELDGAVPFGRQGDDADPSACCVLESAELVPVRVAGVLERMGAARTVFVRDVGPLQVDADGRVGDLLVPLARPGDRAHARRHDLGRLGADGGAVEAYARCVEGLCDRCHVIDRCVLSAQVVASEPVDLDVQKRRADHEVRAAQCFRGRRSFDALDVLYEAVVDLYGDGCFRIGHLADDLHGTPSPA